MARAPSGGRRGTRLGGNMNRAQVLIGVGVLGLAVLMAAGAVHIPAEAGYSGVGPNFLPWLVATCLLVSAGFLLWEATSGGFRSLGEPDGAERGDWPGFAWVSVGILANAALITTIGFILSCAL